MNRRGADEPVANAAWYEVAFDDLYAELYAHRDQAEAERAVAWLDAALAELGPARLAGERWVDLACGAGRHLRALARRGARGVGLDRSPPLLGRAAAARRAAGGGEELVRGDLRALPFAPAAFAGALSMFTSLGYFEDEGENQRMLEEVARVVRGGGAFLVDYLNAAALERALVPASTRVAGRYRVEEKRRIDRARRRIIKEVAIFGEPGGAALRRHVESVALWSQRELEDRLAAAGFRARARAGDYDGQPFAPLSPRLLVLAVREE